MHGKVILIACHDTMYDNVVLNAFHDAMHGNVVSNAFHRAIHGNVISNAFDIMHSIMKKMHLILCCNAWHHEMHFIMI